MCPITREPVRDVEMRRCRSPVHLLTPFRFALAVDEMAEIYFNEAMGLVAYKSVFISINVQGWSVCFHRNIGGTAFKVTQR